MGDGISNNDQHGEGSNKRREMSRRQFLTYTLGATGGFLAAGITIPMIRFAVDPLLTKSEGSEFVKVAELNQVGAEPIEVRFEVLQVDGWVESNPELIAWLVKNDAGDVIALSPVCKHLGCTVNWEKAKSEFFCPCHAAEYAKDGKNLKVAPLPLDEYAVKIENGSIYLGQIQPNRLAGAKA